MIYITGANGWLGLNFLDLILNGRVKKWGLNQEEVSALILPRSDKSKIKALSDEIRIYEADLRDYSSLNDYFQAEEGSILFHLAGVIHPKKISDFYSINRDGTKNILNAAAKKNVKKIVIMSSNSPCGCNVSPSEFFNEKSAYNPYMNYGRSKMEMEIFANNFHSKKKANITIIRSPWFYGPFQPKRQKTFFEMIRKGKVPVVGNGENLRSMGYVDNLIQGMALASVQNISSGKTYWIADENPYTMNEIVNTIESILINDFKISCKGARVKMPHFVGQFAEYCDYSLQKIGLYNQKIHVLSEMNKNIACSIDLAKKELGFRPEFNLKKGMKKSLAEFYS